MAEAEAAKVKGPAGVGGGHRWQMVREMVKMTNNVNLILLSVNPVNFDGKMSWIFK